MYNKKKQFQWNKNYYWKNREKINEKRRERWKNRTSEQIKKQREKKRIWRKENRKRLSEKHRIYVKGRVLTPENKLNQLMKVNINQALSGTKNRRCWHKLVGYTLEELRLHLEKQFDENMSWENRGTYWHIDHIKPKSLFNYICPEDKEFKECWSLTNLQPLEAKENIRKSNKY